MTKNRDLKRRIRSRMKKTGESYTAARRHVLVPPRARSPLPLGVAVRDQDLESALVSLALDARPGLEAWRLWAALDHLASRLRGRLRAVRGDRERLLVFLHAVFGELGFSVPEDYDDPALNLLDRVLETRRGTPAALAGLLLLLGRRLGFELAPVAFPGHFLLRAEVGRPVWIDPASGSAVPREGLLALAARELDLPRAEVAARLEPADVRPLVVRLLQNLGRAYGGRGQRGPSLQVADRLVEVSGTPSERCDRGLQLWAMGAIEAAREDVGAYLAANPGAPDADLLARALRRLRPSPAIWN